MAPPRLARLYVGMSERSRGRVAREYAAGQRARANDPATVAAIRKGIDAKVAQWRAELEAKWEAEKKFIMDRDLPNSLTKPR